MKWCSGVEGGLLGCLEIAVQVYTLTILGERKGCSKHGEEQTSWNEEVSL